QNHSFKIFDKKQSKYIPEDVEQIIGDIRDKNRLEEAMEDVDVVFHMATVPPSVKLSKKEIHDIDVGGTKNLVDAAFENGVKKVVYTSSASHVYGIPKSSPPIKENSGLNPVNEYGKSKVESEQILKNVSRQNQLNTIVLRLSMVVGPYNSDPILIENLRNFIHDKKVFVAGEGSSINQSMHIQDVNRALFAAAKNNSSIDSPYEVFNISGKEVLTVNEWMSTVKKICSSESKIVHLPVFLTKAMTSIAWFLNQSKIHPSYIDLLTHDQYFDISKAEKVLDWKPKHTAEEGLIKTVEFLENNKNFYF
ncbi:MAG: NAD(P)-dependent oxidoreductase, partial [Candidatus Thermoplasmatota archaeon]